MGRWNWGNDWDDATTKEQGPEKTSEDSGGKDSGGGDSGGSEKGE